MAISSISAALVGLLTTAPPPRSASVTQLAAPAVTSLAALKERVGPGLAQLRAGRGWCLDEDQLADLRRQKEQVAVVATLV